MSEKYVIQDSTLTGLANGVRNITNTTAAQSTTQMTNAINTENTNLNTQATMLQTAQDTLESKAATGSDGGYYVPAVDSAGVLSWSGSKTGMPAVASQNIKGPAGPAGTNGTDGRTPVKGTDYFTEADIAEIVDQVKNTPTTVENEVIIQPESASWTERGESTYMQELSFGVPNSSSYVFLVDLATEPIGTQAITQLAEYNKIFKVVIGDTSTLVFATSPTTTEIRLKITGMLK